MATSDSLGIWAKNAMKNSFFGMGTPGALLERWAEVVVKPSVWGHIARQRPFWAP